MIQTHLDFLFQFTLETRPEDLALTGFQTISNGRDRTDIIRHRKTDELLVDEFGVRNFIEVMIKICSRLKDTKIRLQKRRQRSNYRP